MLDLSKYVNNKDGYISRVEISPDFDKYKVIYASGREEESDFTIHNYQVALYRMEQQYKENVGHYKSEVSGSFFKQLKSALIWSIIDVVGIVFQCNVDTPVWSKILFIFMFCLAIVGNFKQLADKFRETQFRMMKSAVVDAYLEHKEEFAIDVKDKNGSVEKWYVVDVNDLEKFGTVFELSLAALPLQNPQVRVDMAERGLVKLGKMNISVEK